MGLFSRRQSVSQELREAILLYIASTDATAALDTIEYHPLLLGDQADELMTKTVAVARTDGREDDAQNFEVQREVLRYVRAHGATTARAELDHSDPTEGARRRLEAGASVGLAELSAYQSTGDPGALDRALSTLEAVVERSQELELEEVDFYATLGWALISATEVDAAEAASRATNCFTRALEIAVPEAPGCARLSFGLSSALMLRDGPGDLERSMAVSRSALKTVGLDGKLALALSMALSPALVATYRRSLDEDLLNEAVAVLDDAIDRSDSEFAGGQAHLILAYALTTRYDEFGARHDLLRAREIYESLVPRLPASSPPRMSAGADALLVLNKVWLATGDQRYLDQAIELGRQLLAETPEAAPPPALVQQRLGTVLMNRAGGADFQLLAEAADLIEESLDDDAPSNLEALFTLLGARFSCYQLTDAIVDLQRAHLAGCMLLDAVRESFGQLGPAEYLIRDRENWSVFSLVTTCMLARAEVDVAARHDMRRDVMVTLEMGKARLLTEQLGRSDLAAPEGIATALVARERLLVGELVDYDRGELADFRAAAQGARDCPEQTSAKRHELKMLWKEIEEISPAANDWVRLRRGEPPAFGDLQSLASPGTAVISLGQARRGLLACVLIDEADEPVVVESDLREGDVEGIIERLGREITPAGRAREETWHRLLRPFAQAIGSHLAGAERVILAPEAVAHLIPWAAVADRAGWRSPDGAPLPIITTPSLGILPALHGRGASTARGALVVGDADCSLPFARREAEVTAAQLGVRGLFGPEATRDVVLSGLRTAAIVHLATHAHFDVSSPLDAGIALADGVLDARQILETPINADLVVLSACETGRVTTLGGNEMAGLGYAFLHAGARVVVTSLWRVDDEATSVLMKTFYERLEMGDDAATALSRAGARVRSEPRWQHPAFWGAFEVLGDAGPRSRPGAAGDRTAA